MNGQSFHRGGFSNSTVPWQQEVEGNHPLSPQNILQPFQKIGIAIGMRNTLSPLEFHNDLIDCLPLCNSALSSPAHRLSASTINQWKQPDPLSTSEQQMIVDVIKRAEQMEKAEKQRLE